MNNENKYLFINNLPKEYHKILWDIMISSESDKELEVNLKKHDSKLIMRYLFKKDKEIERLNNIINELEKCIKDKYYEAVDYQTKIRQSDLMQGDYPVSYYLSEQNEQLCNYFLNRLKDLQELKGSDKE